MPEPREAELTPYLDKFNQMMQEKTNAISQFKINEMLGRLQKQRQTPGLEALFGKERGRMYAEFDPAMQRELAKQQYQTQGVQALYDLMNGVAGQQNGMTSGNNTGMPAEQFAGQGKMAPVSYGPSVPQMPPKAPAGLTMGGLEKFMPFRQKEIHHAQEMQQKVSEADKNREFKESQRIAGEQFKNQEEIKKYVGEKHNEASTATKQLKTLDRMQKLLEKGRQEFPNAFVSGSATLEHLFNRGKSVSEFRRLANEYVKLEAAGAGSGRNTEYYTKLVEAGKPNTKMDPAAIEEAIKTLKEDKDNTIDNYDYLVKLQDKKTGRYPENIKEKVTGYEISRVNPLDYPEYYDIGNRLVEDDGTEYRLIEKNGIKEWKEVNA
jgi:hypothetical protein